MAPPSAAPPDVPSTKRIGQRIAKQTLKQHAGRRQSAAPTRAAASTRGRRNPKMISPASPARDGCSKAATTSDNGRRTAPSAVAKTMASTSATSSTRLSVRVEILLSQFRACSSLASTRTGLSAADAVWFKSRSFVQVSCRRRRASCPGFPPATICSQLSHELCPYVAHGRSSSLASPRRVILRATSCHCSSVAPTLPSTKRNRNPANQSVRWQVQPGCRETCVSRRRGSLPQRSRLALASAITVMARCMRVQKSSKLLTSGSWRRRDSGPASAARMPDRAPRPGPNSIPPSSRRRAHGEKSSILNLQFAALRDRLRRLTGTLQVAAEDVGERDMLLSLSFKLGKLRDSLLR